MSPDRFLTIGIFVMLLVSLVIGGLCAAAAGGVIFCLCVSVGGWAIYTFLLLVLREALRP